MTWENILVRLHPLSNIEITSYFNWKARFNSVFSKDNLPRIKCEAYVIIQDNKESKRRHWISLFIVGKYQKYGCVLSPSFGIEYITQDVQSKIKDKSIAHNISRRQFDDSVICGF